MKFDTGKDDSEKYKVEAIWDSEVYVRESESGHLPGFYYLVSWKGYPEEENTWELASVVQQHRKLISSFHKDHLDKLTTTSPTINIAPPMAKPTVKPTGPPKQKRGQLANSINKWAKTNWTAFEFYLVFGQIRVTLTLDIPSRNTSDCMWLHVTTCDLHLTFIKTSFKVLTSSAF